MSAISEQERRNSRLMESLPSPREQALVEIKILGEAERGGIISLEVRNIWNRVMNWKGGEAVTGELTMDHVRDCRSKVILQYVDGVIEERMCEERIKMQLYRFASEKQGVVLL
jgi:hypothetical protein